MGFFSVFHEKNEISKLIKKKNALFEWEDTFK